MVIFNPLDITFLHSLQMKNILSTLQDVQEFYPFMTSAGKCIILWSASGLVTDETLGVQILSF